MDRRVRLLSVFPPGGGDHQLAAGPGDADYAQADRSRVAVSLRIGSGRGVSYNVGPPYVGGSPLIDADLIAEATVASGRPACARSGYWWLDPHVDLDLQADLAVSEVLRRAAWRGPILPDVEDTGSGRHGRVVSARAAALVRPDRRRAGVTPLLYTGATVVVERGPAATRPRSPTASWWRLRTRASAGTPAEPTPLGERPPSDASGWRDWAVHPQCRRWSRRWPGWSTWYRAGSSPASPVGDYGFVTRPQRLGRRPGSVLGVRCSRSTT